MPVELPILGVGAEYTHSWDEELVRHARDLDCIEIIPENFFGRPANSWVLDELVRSGVPITLHGVELSIGTDQPLKSGHLRRWRELVEQTRPPFISEHLCMTEAGGIEIGQLTPLPRTARQLEVCVRNVSAFQDAFGLPVLLENITNAFEAPGAEMSEPDFMNRLLERTGAFLLLDLNNVRTNARNFGYDPYRWLGEVAVARTGLVHLAGGREEDGVLLDSHDVDVPEEEWAMLDWLLERADVNAIVVERTGNHPAWPLYQLELARAREKLSRTALPRLLAAGAEDLRAGRVEAEVSHVAR